MFTGIVCKPFRVLNAETETGECDSSDRRVETTCTYKCIRGYRLIGSTQRVCQVDGSWSGQPTTCEGIYCIN